MWNRIQCGSGIFHRTFLINSDISTVLQIKTVFFFLLLIEPKKRRRNDGIKWRTIYKIERERVVNKKLLVYLFSSASGQSVQCSHSCQATSSCSLQVLQQGVPRLRNPHRPIPSQHASVISVIGSALIKISSISPTSMKVYDKLCITIVS